ncbi:DUF192 domain-containing protein [Candidatus Gracilibacteria bacterium]|nr:DUF192 domain-containing protein [Candidatus Gracilibacteria bacterium]
MHKVKIIVLSCTLFLTGCEFFQEPEVYTPSIHLSLEENLVRIDTREFSVEIADTPQKRAQGLMNRERLESDHGMLFVFEEEGFHRFWMRNTLIPLDVIWISKESEVVDVQTLLPCKVDSCPVTSPVSPAKYVIEVNANEFQGKKGDPFIRTLKREMHKF